jgi:hypothetical protein
VNTDRHLSKPTSCALPRLRPWQDSPVQTSALLQHIGEQLVEPRVTFGHTGFHARTQVSIATLDGLVQRRGRDCGLAVPFLEVERLERFGIGIRIEDERPDDPLRWNDLARSPRAARTGIVLRL